MAKTIDDLQTLLSNHGYACELPFDVLLKTQVRTNTYKDPSGSHTLDILLSFDRPNDCVAVEVLRAFDLRTAEYREATLACLMAASFRTALLRPSLDPADGEIRLRIDCPCSEEGARDADVLRAMALLPTFVDAWYPQVVSAMRSGEFEANNVPRLNLSRILCDRPPGAHSNQTEINQTQTNQTQINQTGNAAAESDKPVSDEAAANRSPFQEIARAASMSQKPGANPNRLRALFAFHRRHDRRSDNPTDCN